MYAWIVQIKVQNKSSQFYWNLQILINEESTVSWLNITMLPNFWIYVLNIKIDKQGTWISSLRFYFFIIEKGYTAAAISLFTRYIFQSARLIIILSSFSC